MNSISKLFGGEPKRPYVPPASSIIKVSEKQPQLARDELLRRLAKLRRATMTSELSNPNIRRKQLGAGV